MITTLRIGWSKEKKKKKAQCHCVCGCNTTGGYRLPKTYNSTTIMLIQCQSPLHWHTWFGMKKNLTNPKDISTGVNPWKGCIDVKKSFSVLIRTFFPHVSLFWAWIKNKKCTKRDLVTLNSYLLCICHGRNTLWTLLRLVGAKQIGWWSKFAPQLTQWVYTYHIGKVAVLVSLFRLIVFSKLELRLSGSQASFPYPIWVLLACLEWARTIIWVGVTCLNFQPLYYLTTWVQ